MNRKAKLTRQLENALTSAGKRITEDEAGGSGCRVGKRILEQQERDAEELYVIPAGVAHIGNGAFAFRKNLSRVVIPGGVESIGNYAFACCSLSSVIISPGVTSIGCGAFSGCTNLTSVVIPESVTSIGVRAFSGCTNLTRVIIPQGVRDIGAWAFRWCPCKEQLQRDFSLQFKWYWF